MQEKQLILHSTAISNEIIGAVAGYKPDIWNTHATLPDFGTSLDPNFWLQLLLQCKASISSKQKALDYVLRSNKLDVNAQNTEGNTALFYATSVEMVDLLVKHGANVNIKNKKGCLFLHYLSPEILIGVLSKLYPIDFSDTSLLPYLLQRRMRSAFKHMITYESIVKQLCNEKETLLKWCHIGFEALQLLFEHVPNVWAVLHLNDVITELLCTENPDYVLNIIESCIMYSQPISCKQLFTALKRNENKICGVAMFNQPIVQQYKNEEYEGTTLFLTAIQQHASTDVIHTCMKQQYSLGSIQNPLLFAGQHLSAKGFAAFASYYKHQQVDDSSLLALLNSRHLGISNAIWLVKEAQLASQEWFHPFVICNFKQWAQIPLFQWISFLVHVVKHELLNWKQLFITHGITLHVLAQYQHAGGLIRIAVTQWKWNMHETDAHGKTPLQIATTKCPSNVSCFQQLAKALY